MRRPSTTTSPHWPGYWGGKWWEAAFFFFFCPLAHFLRLKGSCSQEEAQMRIYDASWDGSYEFSCEIDDEASRDLASMLLNPRSSQLCTLMS